jgi:hypothetical protein
MIREVSDVHPKSETMKEMKRIVESGDLSHAHVYWLIELVTDYEDALNYFAPTYLENRKMLMEEIENGK